MDGARLCHPPAFQLIPLTRCCEIATQIPIAVPEKNDPYLSYVPAFRRAAVWRLNPARDSRDFVENRREILFAHPLQLIAGVTDPARKRDTVATRSRGTEANMGRVSEA